MTPRARLWLPLLAIGLAASACASPEAARTRGVGRGADPGNHGSIVQIHGGAEVYYRTPCRTANVKCSGPLPDAGT